MPRLLFLTATTLSLLLSCYALYVATIRRGDLYTHDLDADSAKQLHSRERAGIPSDSPNISGYFHSRQIFPGLWISDYSHWSAIRTYYASRPLLFAIAFLAALLPARQIRLFIKQREQTRRARAHRCPICHYDLRATPTRCPECGHTPGTPA